MIGRPNAGNPLASYNNICSTARDFIISASSTHIPQNPHKNYWLN